MFIRSNCPYFAEKAPVAYAFVIATGGKMGENVIDP